MNVWNQIKHWIRGFAVVSFIAAGSCFATEYQPWFGNALEFEFRSLYTFQTYSDIDTGTGSISKPSDDHFLNLSLAISPLSQWSGELELLVVHTSGEGAGVAHGRMTVRHRLLDDIVGDPVSLTSGVALTLTSKDTLRDLSTPYHGDIECEFHMAMGKELSEGRHWFGRLWGIVGFGVANEGSPWVRGDVSLEYNRQNNDSWALFFNSLWGLNSRALSLDETFYSYGPVNHGSIDVGARYNRTIGYCGEFTFQYAHRVFARSYPEHAHLFTIAFMYPFAY